MNNKGFCDHCYNWGMIIDPERNMCIDCREQEIGREMQAKRPASQSMRALSERNTRRRG